MEYLYFTDNIMISIQVCNFTPGGLRDLGSGSDCAPLVHSEQHAFCNLKNMRINNFQQSAECQGHSGTGTPVEDPRHLHFEEKHIM